MPNLGPEITISGSNPRTLTTPEAWGVYCEVTYSAGRGDPASLNVATPTFTGLVSSIESMSTSTNTEKEYIIRLNPNTSTSPVTSSVTFTATTDLGSTSKVFYLYHPASGSGSKPSNPSVSVFPTQTRVAWQGGTAKPTVTYVGIPDWYMLAPRGADGLTVTSRSTYQEGWTSSYEYTFTVPTNNTNQSKAYHVTFSMRTGSESVGSYVRNAFYDILQYPSQSEEPTSSSDCVFNPSIQGRETNRVNWDTTYYSLQVTYVSGCNFDYVQNYTTTGMSSVNVAASQTDNNNLVYNYGLSFPVNSSTESRARTITVRIASGSVSANRTFVITQGPKSSGDPLVSANPAEQNVVHVGGDVDIQVSYNWNEGYTIQNPSGTTLSYSIISNIATPSSSIYTYRFVVPANHTADWRHYYPTFSMISGSNVKSTFSAIHQWGQATTKPRISVNPTMSRAAAAGAIASTVVGYGGQPSWTIQNPVTNLQYERTYISSSDTRSFYRYNFTVPANPNPESRGFYVSFSIASNSLAVSESYHIVQYPSQSEDVGVVVTSPVAVGWSTQSIIIPVLYKGIYDGTDPRNYIANPLVDGIDYYSWNHEIVGRDVQAYYTASFPQNTGQYAVERSMYFSFSSGGYYKGAEVTINQGSQGSPQTAKVTASPLEQNVSKDGGTAEFVVGYETPVGWGVQEVNWEGRLYPTTVTVYQTPSGSIWTYRFTVDANPTDQARDFHPVFSVASGSSVVSASTIIHQAAGQGDIFDPSITGVNYVNVPWNSNNSLIRIFYNQGKSFDYVQTPVLNRINGISATSWSEGSNLVYDYSLDYSQNPSDTAITRSVTFSIRSGSVSASKTVEVRQARSGSATRKSVILSYYNKTLGSQETETSIVATYRDISDFSLVGTPYCSIGEWTAIPAGTSQVGNDLNVEWILRGTANNSSSPRGFYFDFDAYGQTSARAVFNQIGTGGDSPVTDSSSFLAWKDTNTEIPGGHYIVTAEDLWRKEASTEVTTGSDPFLREHLYAAPGESSIKVNLNRVVEGLVEPRELKVFELPNPTPIGYVWPIAGTRGQEGRYAYLNNNVYPVAGPKIQTLYQEVVPFRFQINYEGVGVESFGSKYLVLDNWSYSDNSGSYYFYSGSSKQEGLLLSKFPQKKLLPNQYVPVSILHSGNNPYIQVRVIGDYTSLGTEPHAWDSNLLNYVREHQKDYENVPIYQDLLVRLGGPLIQSLYNCSMLSLAGGTNAEREIIFTQEGWETQGKFVVYYLNDLGGFDSLPFRGPVVPSTQNTSNTYLTYTRKRKVYQTDQTRKFVAQTGTVSDEESVFVEEMVTSPRVYLHNLETDEIIPVRPTTGTVEKKTFWNQGRKFANYQIELEDLTAYLRR